MRAYSTDLRERVVAAVDGGMTHERAATVFGMSVRTVERYLQRRRATGSLAPTGQRHGPVPEKKTRLQAWLPARLAEAADATLAEHAAASPRAPGGGVAGDDVPNDRHAARRRPGAGGDCVGASAAAGPAVEVKSLSATERDETARARWRTDMAATDPADLLFVDECGTHTPR